MPFVDIRTGNIGHVGCAPEILGHTLVQNRTSVALRTLLGGCLARLPHLKRVHSKGEQEKKSVWGGPKKKITKILAGGRERISTPIYPTAIVRAKLSSLLISLPLHPLSVVIDVRQFLSSSPFRHNPRWLTKFTTVPLVSIWVRNSLLDAC